MTNRENVLRAIKFEKPETIPFTVSPLPAAFLKHGQALMDLLKQYPNDFYDVEKILKIPETDKEHYKEDGSYFKAEFDEWSCLWHYYQEGISGEVKKGALEEDWGLLDSYSCPFVDESSVARQKMRKDVELMKTNGFVGWGDAGQLYERMQYLRGPENMMFDVMDDPSKVGELADKMLTEYLLPNIRMATQAGAEVVSFADDWGTQLSLLINPDTWREIFKPRYKRMFDLVHEGGALTRMHSDGMILEIIPDLIEIGLNVINPQCNCIDLAKLKSLIDHKLCIVPDIDRQHLLPNGTPEEIRNHIKMIHDTFSSSDGGLIYTCEFMSDVSLENIEAVLKAFQEFRKP